MLDFIPTNILYLIALVMGIGLLGPLLINRFFSDPKAGWVTTLNHMPSKKYQKPMLGFLAATLLFIGGLQMRSISRELTDEQVFIVLTAGLSLFIAGLIAGAMIGPRGRTQQHQQPGLRVISKDLDGNPVVTPFERRKKDR